MRGRVILVMAIASLGLGVASISAEEAAKGAAGSGASSGPPASTANFGAIAFSQNSGAEGYGENYKTREEAEQRAMKECGARSNGQPCEIVSWCQKSCCAVAVGKGNGWGGFWALTLDKAEAAALEKCSTQTTNCKVRRSLCAL